VGDVAHLGHFSASRKYDHYSSGVSHVTLNLALSKEQLCDRATRKGKSRYCKISKCSSFGRSNSVAFAGAAMGECEYVRGITTPRHLEDLEIKI
jgi:hypothetical protein